jgi:hypothetical protein
MQVLGDARAPAAAAAAGKLHTAGTELLGQPDVGVHPYSYQDRGSAYNTQYPAAADADVVATAQDQAAVV